MSLYSSVDCDEEYGTAKESWNIDDVSMSVTLRCAWADRYDLVDDLLGNGRTWPHGSFTNAPRAQSASIAPDKTAYTATGQCIVYNDALVTVTYGTEHEDLVSESLEPTADFITLDWRRFRWSSDVGDPLIEGEAPGKLRRGLNIVRTLYKIATPPTQLLTQIGNVNPSTYTSSLLGLSFAAETLLFTPPTMSRTIRTDGTEGWTINMKFMYKPETWNKYWRAKTSSYEHIYNGTGVYRSYALGNFSDLLF